MTAESLSSAEIERLRSQWYNATVVGLRRCHEDLMIVRVRPDLGVPPLIAGQYTVLGLGYWELRVADTQPEGDISRPLRTLVRRAYSLSCPMIDEAGQLLRVGRLDYLEFYISLVRRAVKHPPALTPRLFALREGDRLFCGPHFHGRYTLAAVARDQSVVFVATGTGEAPHNAMLTDLLATGHRGRIVSAACVRYQRDFGYEAEHRRLQDRLPSYCHLTLTTREPVNLIPTTPGYVGRRYLQDYVASGDFERDAGLTLDPQTTHVFLCGSPDMIGVPLHTHDPEKRYPWPVGMIETLERRGFHIDQPHAPGNVHFERYW